ncbi:hypothetical protein [uncultured Desulfobacter sp.]|uniref:hypothetical protein n=1 Tax=uncultured Desulfobacter sp. TaxID=240139 RepID=UPI002AA86B97|nr:hypothetical protein [uncultured Desulfobacter sp.]
MYEDQDEMKRLDAGWRVILMIWGAILASLGVYLIICINVGKFLQVNIDSDFPLTTVKYSLFAMACVTIIGVHIFRKFLLTPGRSVDNSMQMPSTQHPAIAKYTIAVVITSALLESIGIYGVVLFFLAKDARSLYQLLIISAAAMIYFRPRKKELIDMATQIRAHQRKLNDAQHANR